MTIRGRTQFIGGLPDPRFEPVVAAVMEAAGDIAYSDMRRRFEPHSRTGRTQEAMGLERRGAEGFRLFNPLETAGFIEFGTSPHPIEPRDAQALRFYGNRGNRQRPWRSGQGLDSAGLPIFATHVDHPGTDADPFMEPAVTENAPLFEEMLADAIEAEWER